MHFESIVQRLNNFHSAQVLVLGDVMLDRFVYGTVERISPEAPIPVLKVGKSQDMPGGAANVARNIVALGARVILFGVVGDDAAAHDLRTQLAVSPALRTHLVTDDSRPTSVKLRYVADGQQVMRADSESRTPITAAVAGRLLEAFSQAVAEADLLVLSDYAKGVLSDAVIRAAIDAARALNKTVIVDPKSKEFTKYRGATLITPNRLELAQACGEACDTDEEVIVGARRILKQEICDVLVVTRGKDGMSVVGRDGTAMHLPTAARQVFDVSGAGDTAVAALALSLVGGANFVDAAALANVAAGIAVGKRGTATVTTTEILRILVPADGRTDPLKIFARDSVLDWVRDWREQGLKIAFTNGCFDLLHPGHISLLDQASRTADRLVVGLNSDSSIRRLKGPSRPVLGEIARATVLAALKFVDAVVIFSQDTPLELIETLQPDVLVKGADYTVDTVVGADLVVKRGGRVVLADLLAGHSTTESVKRASAASDKVVILDRDGTLVVDRDYLSDPAGLEFTPGAAEALRWLSDHGYRLIVATNQSGVGRGYFSLEQLQRMNARLLDMVESLGVHLERIYFCPHSPEAGCTCRKPATGLLTRAAQELAFNPHRAVVIGDKESDIEFGHRAGAKTILIAGDGQPPSARIKADQVCSNLLDAARAVTAQGW